MTKLSFFSHAIILSLIFSLPASAQSDSLPSDSIRPARTWSGFVALVSPRLFWDSTGVSGFAAAVGPEWYWMRSPARPVKQVEGSLYFGTVAIMLEAAYRNHEFFVSPLLSVRGGLGMGPFLPVFIGGAIGPRFAESGVSLWGRLSAGVGSGPIKIGAAMYRRLSGESAEPALHYAAFIDIPTSLDFLEGDATVE